MTSAGEAGTAVAHATTGAVRPAGAKSQTFSFTGKPQTFIVPFGVKRVTITAMGAGTPLAHGGLVAGTIAVKPGEPLAVFVGGVPNAKADGYNTGGYNGGGDACTCGAPTGPSGGAGASDVRQGGSTLRDRVLVAGGAGGRGGKAQYHGGRGGIGGGLTAGQGRHGVSSAYGQGSGGGGDGGTGGTQNQGGGGGKAGTSSGRNSVGGINGGAGALGIGGGGGLGADPSCYLGGGGGGGGGGYYGGGGGGSGGSYVCGSAPPSNSVGVGSGGGGGGGSSFVVKSATNVTIQKGNGSTGAGQIIISW